MYQMPVIKAPQRGGPYSFPLSSLNSLPSIKGRGLAPNSAPFYLPLTTLRPGAGLPAACPEGRCDWFKGLPPEPGRRPEQHLPSIHFSSHFHRLQVQWTDGQTDEHCPCRGVGEARGLREESRLPGLTQQTPEPSAAKSRNLSSWLRQLGFNTIHPAFTREHHPLSTGTQGDTPRASSHTPTPLAQPCASASTLAGTLGVLGPSAWC